MRASIDLETRPSNAGRRFLLGLALGLIPAALMTTFGFTQCPPYDYTCHDPNQGWGAWFFIAAVAAYGVQLFATLVCRFIRRVRPVALGLLLMLLVAPVLGLWGYVSLTVVRHPTPP